MLRREPSDTQCGSWAAEDGYKRLVLVVLGVVLVVLEVVLVVLEVVLVVLVVVSMVVVVATSRMRHSAVLVRLGHLIQSIYYIKRSNRSGTALFSTLQTYGPISQKISTSTIRISTSR